MLLGNPLNRLGPLFFLLFIHLHLDRPFSKEWVTFGPISYRSLFLAYGN